MKLTPNDLKQMNEEWLDKLDHDQMSVVSKKLLSDLKEAHDRLNQTPQNSSRPSGSQEPWKRGASKNDSPNGEADNKSKEVDKKEEASKSEPNENKDSGDKGKEERKEPKKKAGKQVGGKGFGRTQKLSIHKIEPHYCDSCAACGIKLEPLSLEAHSVAYAGWNEVNIAEPRENEAGILIESTRHLLYESRCKCGHVSQAKPHNEKADKLWENIELGEWRLIGARLAGVIVFLSLRMHLSRRGIQEFFMELIGLSLSVGVIDETLREAGRAAADLEAELARNIEEAVLLNIDETSWKEAGKSMWLWVFVSAQTVLYCIGARTLEMLDNVVTEAFEGISMSDGYSAYRHLKNRCRCWAHLMRKLRGLAESTDWRVSQAGQAMLEAFCGMMEAVYVARERGEKVATCEESITRLRQHCENYYHDTHEKLKSVAREFLLDWAVILRQTKEVDLPLTNNVAEQALRHWVIARRISYGTRTESGSRAFALLASVVDTCRRRGASSWLYLASVIQAARKGLTIPPLPIFGVGK
jgi:transposase